MTRQPLVRLYEDEAIVDNFAGGGGASTGIEMAIGRSPDVAINHDIQALAMHRANHPTTRHVPDDVFHVDPVAALRGRRCGLAWFSPDCTYFSKAKGFAPFRDPVKARRIRELIGVVLKWAANPLTRPRVIVIENVQEIEFWCPLGDDGRPNPDKRGQSFQRWCARLRRYGFILEYRRLKGHEFGAGTTRERLFIIARCDGRPIVWPSPTHGTRGRRPARTAAESIDFGIPVPSIFLTAAEAKEWGRVHGVPAPRRPLAAPTLRRIARGVDRFVINAAEPFIIPVTHSGDDRVYSAAEPLRTITAADREFALVAPSLIKYHGAQDGHERVRDVREPLATLDTSNRFGLVAAFLAKHNGGHEATGQRLDRSVDATAHGNHIAEVRAFLVKFYGTALAKSLRLPIDAVTTKDRFGLVIVTVAGDDYVLVDIGMRMLTPRELFNAQGFPGDYLIESGIHPQTGEAIRFSKRTQTRLVGNSVVPHVAAAIVGANLAVA